MLLLSIFKNTKSVIVDVVSLFNQTFRGEVQIYMSEIIHIQNLICKDADDDTDS